ncbi:Splicing factor ESS-2 [Nymphon striatum]|nr:Splicing factor ESS-2 [Nymphon striatum]KAG1670211.1 Splicing factor ESS-2 [Nymphon striatum]
MRHQWQGLTSLPKREQLASAGLQSLPFHLYKIGSAIESIIERDFFSDLKKLRTQKEYLEAVENNDVVKIRELQKKYCKRNNTMGTNYSLCNTPQTFETPVPEYSIAHCDKDLPTSGSIQDKEIATKQLSLDGFLNLNTSEDNESFSEIMETSNQKHMEKHAWLYEKEKEHLERCRQSIALPSIENQNKIKEIGSSVDNWTYTNKNALMYVPDGVELSANEKIQRTSQREINHVNTRYTSIPFNNVANQTAICETAAVKAKAQEGKIGVDGKEIGPQNTPTVNGYGILNSTPSVTPGVAESPIITWGEIEGTPFCLDGSDTPLRNNPESTPSFKMPKISKRDKLAHSLAEDVSKKHRSKKKLALDRMRDKLQSSSPGFGFNTPSSPFNRLAEMSPAARALANKKLGICKNSDKSLRASYTPKSTERRSDIKTPVSARTFTPKFQETSKFDSSLTDNLLNIPNRMKASDFF